MSIDLRICTKLGIVPQYMQAYGIHVYIYTYLNEKNNLRLASSRLCQVSDAPLLQQWRDVEFSGEVWDPCSDLRDVLCYVRGAKRLRIPEEWRSVLPKEI